MNPKCNIYAIVNAYLSFKNGYNADIKNINPKISITGEISIDPKLGKNLLMKFKGGAVSL